MRDIEFRAWNRKGNCWHYFELVDLIIGRAQEAGLLAYEKWCQYTGLKDKNGEKIYEGDILSVPGWRGARSNEVVAYIEVGGSDDMGTNTIGFPTLDDYGKPEVIGNIYENPDLIPAQEK